ncbi:hypothetical protein Clacol_004754 [Clathrus columnatus]|uniref:Adenine DNA glycosylase n=1 Tax=Clathrus columnatus TaxID=1419009 RepID=A0AAV5ACZ7_9AGAM|nr:hypothetical protein Clacol_004754 [Clathrus columnatus]
MSKKRTLSFNPDGPKNKRRKLPATVPTNIDVTNKFEVIAVGRPHSVHLHTLKDVQNFRIRLLSWFETVRHVRGMPWRKPFCDNYEEQSQRAYEVWISEIMLQQTQVATVIPYYDRWMEKFPTINDLAKADIDAVNKLWKGLGYYSRASRLLTGAKKVVDKYNSRLPDDVKILEKEIPGVGRYSAGAVCSIAYGRCVPVVDGNVHRLLSRVLALYSSPKARKTLDLLWKGAEDMVAGYCNPGDVNQALIELGSTVCKVKEPFCESCPLNSGCGAYAEYTGLVTGRPSTDIEDLCQICEQVPPGNAVTRFPMRASKTKSRIETDLVNLIEWRGNGERQFVLVRRPDKGLLAGLYEFPSREAISSDETDDLLHLPYLVLNNLFGNIFSKDKFLKDETALGPRHEYKCDVTYIGDYVHIFSHIRKTYRIISIIIQGGSSPPLFSSSKDQAGEQKTHGIGTDNIGLRAKWTLEKDVSDAK